MRKGVFIAATLLMLSLTVYVYWCYYHPYAAGLRDGYFQKFSRKGNIFKTYEGELLQEGFGSRVMSRNSGLAANYFYFSVADEQVADSLEKCIGKIVTVHYVQYLRSLPWRGDNYNKKNQDPGQYIVDSIVKVE